MRMSLGKIYSIMLRKYLKFTRKSVEPLFTVSTAINYFTQTYSNSNSNYHSLPAWITDMLPHCTTLLFNESPVTPSLLSEVVQ